jgi:PAS domain S-box-containing protein
MSPEMIFVIKSNRITFMNQVGLRLIGASDPKQVLGRSPFEFIHPDCRPTLQDRMARLDKLMTARIVDQKLIRLDGTPVDVDVEIISSRSPDSDEPMIQVFCRELAGQRRLPTTVPEAKEPASRSARTEPLSMAVAEVAHDCNNLLTVIAGYIETLGAAENLTSAQRQIIDDIRKADDDLGNLARRLLLVGRDEIIVPQILNLNTLISGIQRMLQQAVGGRVQLVTTLSAHKGLINADRKQLEQVLINLAINARDAMPNGGTLTIETNNVPLNEDAARLVPGTRPDAFVSLTVRDTGCGMDEQTKPLIFEPYFTTKRPEQGTGLGLSTVYTIVRRNGGFIRVDSQPGAGTSFTLHFPTASPANTEN